MDKKKLKEVTKKESVGLYVVMFIGLTLIVLGFYLMNNTPFTNADLLGSGLASLGFGLPLLKKVHLIELTENREVMNNKKDETENTKVKELI